MTAVMETSCLGCDADRSMKDKHTSQLSEYHNSDYMRLSSQRVVLIFLGGLICAAVGLLVHFLAQG